MTVREYDGMFDLYIKQQAVSQEFLDKATSFDDKAALAWIDETFVPIERACIIVKIVQDTMLEDARLIFLADVFIRACKYFLRGNARTLGNASTMMSTKLVGFALRKMFHKPSNYRYLRVATVAGAVAVGGFKQIIDAFQADKELCPTGQGTWAKTSVGHCNEDPHKPRAWCRIIMTGIYEAYPGLT